MPADDVPAGGVDVRALRATRSGGRSFVANVYAALELLETYRREHRAVVTSRLHCYLPVRSIGVDVDFRPKNRSDVRFDGLIDIDDDAFAAIRDGLLDKLEQVLRRDPRRPRRRRRSTRSGARSPPPTSPPPRRAAASRAGRCPSTPRSPARTAAVAAAAVTARPPAAGDAVARARRARAKGGLVSALGADRLAARARSRPLHLWVLARAATDGLAARLARRFPDLSFTWIPTRGLGRGLGTPTGERPDPVA